LLAVLTSTPTRFTQTDQPHRSDCSSKLLVHIVLYWPTPIDFGSIFTQLCQGVHQPSADGYGSPHRHVLIRELLPCHFRCRIDRCTRFRWTITAVNESFERSRLRDKGLCLPSRRAIPTAIASMRNRSHIPRIFDPAFGLHPFPTAEDKWFSVCSSFPWRSGRPLCSPSENPDR